MRIVAALGSAVLLGVLVGCSPSPSPVETSTPAESPTATSEPTVEQVGDGHTCDETTGDGGSNDLAAIALAVDATHLTATFDLAQPVATDDAMLGLNVLTQTDDDPDYEMHQLGVKWLDGQIIGFFDFSFKSGMQENFDYSDVVVDGQRVTVKWPASIIEGLGADWRWFAFATHHGVDTDACPGQPLSFDTLTYQT